MKNFRILLSLIYLILFSSLTTIGQAKYASTYKSLADSLSKIYKIPSALILGIAIVESGAGSAKNAKLLNNHFGIVGHNDLLYQI